MSTRFRCRKCETDITIPELKAGNVFACPTCRQEYTVPSGGALGTETSSGAGIPLPTAAPAAPPPLPVETVHQSVETSPQRRTVPLVYVVLGGVAILLFLLIGGGIFYFATSGPSAEAETEEVAIVKNEPDESGEQETETTSKTNPDDKEKQEALSVTEKTPPDNGNDLADVPVDDGKIPVKPRPANPDKKGKPATPLPKRDLEFASEYQDLAELMSQNFTSGLHLVDVSEDEDGLSAESGTVSKLAASSSHPIVQQVAKNYKRDFELLADRFYVYLTGDGLQGLFLEVVTRGIMQRAFRRDVHNLENRQRVLWPTLITVADEISGPTASSPVIQLTLDGANGALSAQNISQEPLNHCTLSVEIKTLWGDRERSVYYFDEWRNGESKDLPPGISWGGALRYTIEAGTKFYCDELKQTPAVEEFKGNYDRMVRAALSDTEARCASMDYRRARDMSNKLLGVLEPDSDFAKQAEALRKQADEIEAKEDRIAQICGVGGEFQGVWKRGRESGKLSVKFTGLNRDRNNVECLLSLPQGERTSFYTLRGQLVPNLESREFYLRLSAPGKRWHCSLVEDDGLLGGRASSDQTVKLTVQSEKSNEERGLDVGASLSKLKEVCGPGSRYVGRWSVGKTNGRVGFRFTSLDEETLEVTGRIYEPNDSATTKDFQGSLVPVDPENPRAGYKVVVTSVSRNGPRRRRPRAPATITLLVYGESRRYTLNLDNEGRLVGEDQHHVNYKLNHIK